MCRDDTLPVDIRVPLTTPRTILIADDHAMFLQGLATVVSKIEGCEIISSASSGSEALEKILDLRPAVAILDGAMPGLTGIEVMEELADRRLTPPVTCILLTMFSHPQLLADAIEAGAAACVSKKDAARELAKAIDQASSSQFYASTALNDLYADVRSGNVTGLTRRERQIMNAIVAGATNKEMAQQLGIAVKTVDTHRERLMKKIGAHNAADIVRYAMQMGVGMI